MSASGEKRTVPSRPGTPSGGGSGPWRLHLICCGRDDGHWRCPTWDDAHALRLSYIETKSHERSAVLTYEPEGGAT